MERKMVIPWESGVNAMEVCEDRVEDLFDAAWARQSEKWSTPLQRMTMAHDVAVIYLEGEIGLPEFHYIEGVLRSLREKGVRCFVFSFESVEHVNYKVFWEWMGLAKTLRLLSGDVRFTQISQYLYHIFLFSGADQTIDHFSQVEDAILSFHNTHGRHWH